MYQKSSKGYVFWLITYASRNPSYNQNADQDVSKTDVFNQTILTSKFLE